MVCDVILTSSLERDQEGGPERGINLPRVTQPVGTGHGFFHSPCAGARSQLAGWAWGTHRGRSALSHGRSVSIAVEHSCRAEEQSQTFRPTWGQLQACFCLQSTPRVPTLISCLCPHCLSLSYKPTATAPIAPPMFPRLNPAPPSLLACATLPTEQVSGTGQALFEHLGRTSLFLLAGPQGFLWSMTGLFPSLLLPLCSC